jgi:hypothetical protein
LEPELKNRSSNFADRERVKINKKLLIYLFFLLISIALWYLNALSKDYTTFVYYKVRYENFPKGKALVSDMPEKLAFKVRGLGFSVLKHKILALTRTIDFPIDNFRLNISRKDNQYNYFLLTRYAREWFSTQLTSDIQLIDIQPDTLVFKFADVVDRKFPVKPLLNLEFEKQYMQNGPFILKPDSVIASGPQVMLDTLRCLFTKELKRKHVKDTLTEDLELEPIDRLSFPISKVSVTVPVEKYTELNISVPIEAINVPDGMRVRTFPGSINVSCWVGVSSYDKMTPFMFRVKTPPNIQNIRFSPKSIEYLIEK